jgi:IS5 family transposase
MIRMLLVGYCSGIRSERRLCEEVHLNLAYRWFCRLDLSGRIPDHSTFSKNRHGRFRESGLLRHVFETTVARCMKEGLLGGQGFVVDASLISADVQKQNSSNPEDWATRAADVDDAPIAVQEYLDTLDDEAFGAATTTTPKFTAHSDPASQCLSVIYNHLPVRDCSSQRPRFLCVFHQLPDRYGSQYHR